MLSHTVHVADTSCCLFYFFFFFNDTATTEIYTLSLHDALPITNCAGINSPCSSAPSSKLVAICGKPASGSPLGKDRKSTRLNSSHLGISYAVFCLKKKKQKKQHT